MTYNPYGAMGSIIAPPRQVKVSPTFRHRLSTGTRSKSSSVVVRRADGTIVTPPTTSPAVRLARKVKATGKAVINAPLTPEELRKIALDERKAQFAKQLSSVHLNAND